MCALIWSGNALDQLADLYVTMTPDERERVTGAVEALNQRLRDDPFAEGESRSEGLRITFIPMLSVGFNVLESARTVRVTRVVRYGRR